MEAVVVLVHIHHMLVEMILLLPSKVVVLKVLPVVEMLEMVITELVVVVAEPAMVLVVLLVEEVVMV
jgi:hypothetical protein